MDKNRERVAEEFQDEYLKKYTHLSFEELKKMIGRENLPVQKGLEDFKFAIVISYDKGARSMEVGCFRYSDTPSFPKKFEEILDSGCIRKGSVTNDKISQLSPTPTDRTPTDRINLGCYGE